MGVLPTIRPPGLVSGGGAAWSPDDEAALEIWLDASDVSSITETGGAVSQWNDKSGNGENFSQGTGSRQPTTGSRTLNSLNVIDFDGANHVLNNTTHTFIGSDHQFVFVAEVDSITNAGDTIVRAGGTSRLVFRAGGAAAFNNFVELFGTGNVSAGANTFTEGAPHIFRLVFDFTTNDWMAYMDGTLDHTQTGGYQSAFNNDRFDLMGNTTVGLVDGAFAELLLFSSTDNAIGQRAEGYLAHKWGLEASLPGGHPHSSSPP